MYVVEEKISALKSIFVINLPVKQRTREEMTRQAVHSDYRGTVGEKDAR